MTALCPEYSWAVCVKHCKPLYFKRGLEGAKALSPCVVNVVEYRGTYSVCAVHCHAPKCSGLWGHGLGMAAGRAEYVPLLS